MSLVPLAKKTTTVLVKIKGKAYASQGPAKLYCWAPVNLAAALGVPLPADSIFTDPMPQAGSTHVPKQKRSNHNPSLAFPVPTALFLV